MIEDLSFQDKLDLTEGKKCNRWLRSKPNVIDVQRQSGTASSTRTTHQRHIRYRFHLNDINPPEAIWYHFHPTQYNPPEAIQYRFHLNDINPPEAIRYHFHPTQYNPPEAIWYCFHLNDINPPEAIRYCFHCNQYHSRYTWELQQ